MYSDKDLDSLKEDYLSQDYPDDLNEYVMGCISKQAIKTLNKSKSITTFYVGVAFAVCLLLAILPKTLKKYDTDNNQIVDGSIDSHLSRITVYGDNPENKNSIVENESIISIYTINEEITLKDKIYNIDKNKGVLIELRDILIEGIENIEIDNKLKEILINPDTKFFLGESGDYIILSEDGKIVIDDILSHKIFKSEYVFKS